MQPPVGDINNLAAPADVNANNLAAPAVVDANNLPTPAVVNVNNLLAPAVVNVNDHPAPVHLGGAVLAPGAHLQQWPQQQLVPAVRNSANVFEASTSLSASDKTIQPTAVSEPSPSQVLPGEPPTHPPSIELQIPQPSTLQPLTADRQTPNGAPTTATGDQSAGAQRKSGRASKPLRPRAAPPRLVQDTTKALSLARASAAGIPIDPALLPPLATPLLGAWGKQCLNSPIAFP